MPAPEIFEMPDWHTAFSDGRPTSAWARATYLVMAVGRLLYPDADLAAEELSGEGTTNQAWLNLPQVRGVYWDPIEIEHAMSPPRRPSQIWGGEQRETLLDRRNELAMSMRQEGSAQNLAQVVAFSMMDRFPAARAAASVGWLLLHPTSSVASYQARLLAFHSDEEVAEIAQLVSQFLEVRPDGTPLTKPTSMRGTGPPSVIINGTWARWSQGPKWWQPGGDLHSFVKSNDSPDLCSCEYYFRWPGGNYAQTRDQAAIDLHRWAMDHSGGYLRTVITHSHGAAVAIGAIHRGLKVDLLVLLSAPVPRYLGTAWHQNVKRALSFRSPNDPVVLAVALANRSDFGRRFNDGFVREQHLPMLASHSAPRKARNWRKYSLPDALLFERRIAGVRPGNGPVC